MPKENINCPICKEKMKKRNIPQGLEIDYCETHGVWLDVGELEQVAQQIQADTANAYGQSGGGESTAKSLAKSIGKGLGRSAVFGAGATVGHRIVSGIIDSVFGSS